MRTLKIRRCMAVLIAAVFSTLAGCDGEPVAPQVSADEDARPLFAKAVFKRCKPHVNPASPLLLVAIAPNQAVDVDLGEQPRAPGEFQSQFQLREDRQACGQAGLEYEETDVDGGTAIIGFLILGFTDASVSEEEGRTVVRFRGAAEVCSERDGECRTEDEMTGSVVWEPNDDEPIWQFHAGGVHGSSVIEFPARTRFLTPGADSGESLRGSFLEQAVEVRTPRGP